MTSDETIKWLKQIEEKYIHGGDDYFDIQRKEAIFNAIEIIENQPDKVFTIWQGEYSDKEVIGVAYNEEIAKAYAKLHYGYVETADIITDRNYITKANNMVKMYEFFFDMRDLKLASKEIKYVQEKREVPICDRGYSHYKVTVFENDEKKALKIAKDKLMKYIAERLNL